MFSRKKKQKNFQYCLDLEIVFYARATRTKKGSLDIEEIEDKLNKTLVPTSYSKNVFKKGIYFVHISTVEGHSHVFLV
ncbi:hypothetical protein DERP_007433 [Dermatophagoides pteronyssinus]|uniref:Uncharacterized protein n=1 Tax=Dermatophagoides pteronyssinus TaxID=6956 RepID=A0ABQ8J4Z4_DERPT|nr:hypothetical protein DERP_007433 [Dermatophagoides pteronyssinus]